MNLPELIGIVVAVTEFLKKALAKLFRVKVEGRTAVILACVVSVGVVFFKAVQIDMPLSLGLVPTLVQVIIGSTIGYSIVTK
jgi:hypothetical protein